MVQGLVNFQFPITPDNERHGLFLQHESFERLKVEFENFLTMNADALVLYLRSIEEATEEVDSRLINIK